MGVRTVGDDELREVLVSDEKSRILAFTVEPKRRLHIALDFEGNIDGRAAERRATCVQSASMRWLSPSGRKPDSES